MVNNKTTLQPVLTTQEKIDRLATKKDGWLYFTADTGKMYLDIDSDTRISVGGGGSGASLLFCNAQTVEQGENNTFIFLKESLTDKTAIGAEGDLIINSDGSFYKIESITDDTFVCSRVTTGKGASIWYVQKEDKFEPDDFGAYYIEKGYFLTDTTLCQINDLVINLTDGTIFRIEADYGTNFKCAILALSGGGGGGGNSSLYSERIYAEITNLETTSNLINGQDAFANITVHSAKDKDGKPIDPTKQLQVEITLSAEKSAGVYEVYYRDNTTFIDLDDGQTVKFNYGKYSRPSAKSKMTVVVSGSNDTISLQHVMGPYNMGDLTLTLGEDFKVTEAFEPNQMNIVYNALGAMNRIVDIYWDDMDAPIDSVELTAAESGRNLVCEVYKKAASSLTHGFHTVKLVLSQYVNGERRLKTTPIQFEVGINIKGKQEAILWLGNYKDKYYNYDDIEIPYFVFDPDPENSKVNTKLYKNSIVSASREFSNVSGGSTISSTFEITDAEENVINFYQISCIKGVNGVDSITRDVTFEIIEDTTRDMHLQQLTSLDVLFDSKGRSNDETSASRQTWNYDIEVFNPETQKTETQTFSALFENFNWYNNGWIKTDDGTALRISNGATFKIPIGATTFSGSGLSNQSHTFEFQFKIRNVQSYENLIKSITRYKGDAEYFKEFYGYKYTVDTSNLFDAKALYFIDDESGNKKEITFKNSTEYVNALSTYPVLYTGKETYLTKYTSYDAFLKDYCDRHENLNYDELTNTDSNSSNYDFTQKIFNLNALACGYYSGSAKSPVGFGLGPQDAFFSNGTNTVNASYVEDKMVNLVITYSNTDKLMSIYVNGVLTGVISSTVVGSFKINTDSIIFNSEFCDIDLYKFRVYHTALSINEIVTNYAVDKKDVIMYDQNTLVSPNDKTKFDFKEMEEYNKNHPNDPIMPYIIFDTSKSNNGDRLSWSKKENVTIGVEFVNTALDAAFASGELDKLASEAKMSKEDYYLHHCPSWKGENISMAVQGTSSEFYPRRNYKLKTKDSDKNVHMTMHRGPFANDNNKDIKWFYMDNNSVGTQKFTMKIDFMESSGSYNRGLANLVHNAHSRHPLYYYNQAGAFSQKLYKDFVILDESATYNEKTKYFYKNHKGNYKPADGSESDGLKISSAEDFAKGPIALAKSQKVDKVLGLNTTATNTMEAAKDTSGQDQTEYYNKWLTGTEYYDTLDITDKIKLQDLRTNVQGFPVLAFHKKSNGTYTYIGRYNMLTDKGSDETFGFKADDVYMKYLNNKGIDSIAECWEFENNSRGFCSFRDPKNRKHLSFNTGDYLGGVDPETGEKTGSETTTAPSVVEDFEYRYHKQKDSIDLIVGTDATRIDSLTAEQKAAIKKDTKRDINTNEEGQDLIYDWYANWEKAVQWVWSTCLEEPYTKKQADINNLPTEEQEKWLIEEYVKVAADTEYDSNKKYYTYKRRVYELYTYDEATWADDVAAGKVYELTHPVKVLNGKSYIYDSYEYRYQKFQDELEDHFNLDYLATYFVVTEVLELYDSRGKNCMMASWGPMKQGGDYIWFPIFYDMDTQLGINNTGIPSFEFSTDASEEGCFSTNDSILWNNFYLIYKNQIVQKYCQLKGQTTGIGTFSALDKAPFASVERIEKWYESDPEECNSIVMRGHRPLSAINLDEYYKYIAITSEAGGGYLGRDGSVSYDNSQVSTGKGSPSGTYFYALQGDRSLSRIQFLKNRLNYIDSWLTVGNYERGGKFVMRGRITANNVDKQTGSPLGRTSDIWVEEEGKPYYIDGKKAHEFDGEYWVTMTPSRKSYVTLGEDGLNYGSKQYIDSPVKFEISKLENGIRTSRNYSEQLTYFYGVDTMRSYGNLHNLYFTELYFDYDATQLTDLILGWDGEDAEGNKWFNHDTNAYSFSAMPLLQEANLSNIQYKADVDSKTIDFSYSEKLQNFRATGANFDQIIFAPGVALNTLYLPQTIKELSLTEARQLTNLVTKYEVPQLDVKTGKLVAKPGLFIEKFTDWLDDSKWDDLLNGRYTSSDIVVNILKLEMLNVKNMGYDAYKLLFGYYQAQKNGNDTYQIAMTDVDWSPYKIVEPGVEYIANKYEYYLDNHHYGLDKYEYNPANDYEIGPNGETINRGKQWTDHIANQELYYLDPEETHVHLIDNIKMLEMFVENDSFKGTADTSTVPDITGIIYVDNMGSATGTSNLFTETGVEIDEAYIRNVLQPKYPNLKFFFKNIQKNYTARFLLADDNNPKMYKVIGEQTIKSGWFINPITAYGDISESKANYDFHGWSDSPTGETVYCSKDDPIGTWGSLSTSADKYTYNFYAIFTIHNYKITFYDGRYNDSGSLIAYDMFVPFGEILHAPTIEQLLPSKDDSELELRKTYKHVGWSRSENGNKVTLSAYRSNQDYTFYSIFEEVDVTENTLTINELDYMANPYSDSQVSGGVTVYPKASINQLSGKITIPKTITTTEGRTLTVTGVGLDANGRTHSFTNNKQITHVFFEAPENITIIGQNCFDVLPNLRYIEMPSGLRRIYESACQNCPKLQFPDFRGCNSLSYIDFAAFNSSCQNLGVINYVGLPASLLLIDTASFTNQTGTSITTLEIGDSTHPTSLSMGVTQAKYAIGNIETFNLYYSGELTDIQNKYLTQWIRTTSSNGYHAIQVS